MKKVPDSEVFVIPQSQGAAGGRHVPTVQELEFIARLMDGIFEIPGTRLRFGLDALTGLIPGLGDTISSVVSLYILQAARRHGVSRVTMTRMAANIAVDYVVGIVPVVGDAFDVYWKANQKNVELLRRHVVANPHEQNRLRTDDWLFFAALVAILGVMLVGSIVIAWFVVSGLWTMLTT